MSVFHETISVVHTECAALNSSLKQEAPLKQRGRAMLGVVGHLAKSFKVIRSYSVEHGVYKFLLVFRCNNSSHLFSVSDIFSVR